MNETKVVKRIGLILEVSEKILDKSLVIKYSTVIDKRRLICVIAKIVNDLPNTFNNETELIDEVCKMFETSKKILEGNNSLLIYNNSNIKDERMLICYIAKLISEHWSDYNG